MSDECLKCPVRGACCYLSIPLEGFNVILSNKPCKYLDTKTGLCNTYEERNKVAYCKQGEDGFGCGGLPRGCLLAKDDIPEFFKVDAKSIADKLTPQGLMTYNLMNNHPTIWKIYEEECI